MWRAFCLSCWLHLVGVMGLAAASLNTQPPPVLLAPWPSPSCREALRYACVWHLGDLLMGGSADDVSELLGDRDGAGGRPVGSGECWRYQFLGQVSLTVQFEAGRVSRSWFGPGRSLPGECVGRVERSVRIHRPATPPVREWSESLCAYSV